MKYLFIQFNNLTEQLGKQYLFSLVLSLVFLTGWVVSLSAIGFNFALYVAVMMVVGSLIFITPKIGLPLIILGNMWFQRYFTLQSITWGDLTLKLYPLDVVIAITGISLIFHQAFGNNKQKFVWKKFDKALLFFVFLCSLYFIRSFIQGGADMALSFSAFKNYAIYSVLYFLVIWQLRDLDDLKHYIQVFLIGGLGLLFFVIAGLVLGQGLWVEWNPLSTAGTRFLSFPHTFSLSIVMVLLFVLMLYKQRPQNFSLVILWSQFVGVVGSLQRHIWLSLLGAVLFVFIVVPRSIKKNIFKLAGRSGAAAVLFFTVMALGVIILPTSDYSRKIYGVVQPIIIRAQSLADFQLDSSARWRLYSWKAARDSVLTSPILGIGYGHEITIEFDTYNIVIPMRDLHNSYLVMIVQMGVLGFLVFLYIIWLIFKQFWGLYRAKGIFWPYQLAFFAMFLLFLGSAFWQPYFETNFTGIYFWLILGGFMVSARMDKASARPSLA